ncbi:MAG: hypothetical protein P4L96_15630, partial [Rhodoferax sp.]|nr:hypothetical protein [Rhodoferax sp.]
IQGAFTFGGTGAADEQDPTQSGYGLGYGIGPGGPHYNFSGKVYAEVRWGDQPAGDIMSSLTWNDSAWTPPSGQNLTGQGVAYLYINVGYDASLFPQPPEIRLTVNGKNRIYDPRTGKEGFSTNWALQVADVLADTDYGVGEGPVSGWPTDAIDQLIAAANVCDEQVMTSQGYESNFAQHIHFDTSTPPGEMLAQMMPTAAGRISHIGPSWYIWPAYWQGPSFSFDESALVDTPQWSPTRSFRDLVNRVNGTYTPPNYPYNVAGNLYDRNGWYYGATADNWPLEWQPTNYPQYACDVRHGYASDIYLADDGGVQLPLELSLKGCISIVQAQRVAKIHLLRNRQQGSGSFPMFLAAMQMQPLDVMQFSFPAMGWTDKYLEVGQFQFTLGTARGQNGEEVPTLTTVVPVQETDPSVYEWTAAEELTPYDVPALPGARPYVPLPPTGVTLTDNTTTTVLQSDGSVMPRMLVSWTAPTDTYVNNGGSIQVQWQDYFAVFRGGAWIDVGTFSGQATNCYIDSVSSVETVNVRVRSLWADGTPGAWVQVSNWTPARIQPVLPIRPIGGGGVALQFSSGLTLDQIQPVEVGADQTSNHFAVISGSFPSATTLVSTSWVTLATITVQVSGDGDTLVLFTAQGNAASEMTGFRIQVDGAGSYGYGGFYGATGVASITGLSAGAHTLTLQGIDGNSPVSVPANTCFVLMQQLTAPTGGFKTAPLTTGGVLLTPASIS